MSLFPTSSITIASVPIASSSTTTNGGGSSSKSQKKRKRGLGDKDRDQNDHGSISNGLIHQPHHQQLPTIDIDRIMKTMKSIEKDSGWSGELGLGTSKKKALGEAISQSKKETRGDNKKKAGPSHEKKVLPLPSPKQKNKDEAKGDKVQNKSHEKPKRFEPEKKDPRERKRLKQEKKDAASSSFSPASSSNMTAVPWNRVEELNKNVPKNETARSNELNDHDAIGVEDENSTTVAFNANETLTKPIKPHSAPTRRTAGTKQTEVSQTPPQTSMQQSLRAKLAGGRFRMLNETLYTTSGQEAWNTMKQDGAFDDYHAGFRSQAAHWPVHPLTLIQESLIASLPERSLIADFGCGDATLAKSLHEKGLKVISFDLLSKDEWVVEAECSSVPLPGGEGGEIVDAVVCCLSLMGTDWVELVREARRVLKQEGQFKIAEVSSRFTDVDAFVALISSIGFKLVRKDTKNTHFMLFDFVKSGRSEVAIERGKNSKKAGSLLKACIYKRR